MEIDEIKAGYMTINVLPGFPPLFVHALSDLDPDRDLWIGTGLELDSLVPWGGDDAGAPEEYSGDVVQPNATTGTTEREIGHPC